MKSEIDQSRFIIQRFDNYISEANNKGNVLLLINTFILGVLFSSSNKAVSEIEGSENLSVLIQWLLVMTIVCGLTSMFFVLKAIFPFLNSGNSASFHYRSKIFFKSVAEFKSSTKFLKSYRAQSDKELMDDLARQAFELANGLRSKYYWLGISTWLIYVEILLLFTIFTINIFH